MNRSKPALSITLIAFPKIFCIKLYGTLKFSDDVIDDAVRQVAEPLNEGELRANHAVNKILVMLGLKDEYSRGCNLQSPSHKQPDTLLSAP